MPRYLLAGIELFTVLQGCYEVRRTWQCIAIGVLDLCVMSGGSI